MGYKRLVCGVAHRTPGRFSARPVVCCCPGSHREVAVASRKAGLGDRCCAPRSWRACIRALGWILRVLRGFVGLLFNGLGDAWGSQEGGQPRGWAANRVGILGTMWAKLCAFRAGVKTSTRVVSEQAVGLRGTVASRRRRDGVRRAANESAHLPSDSTRSASPARSSHESRSRRGSFLRTAVAFDMLLRPRFALGSATGLWQRLAFADCRFVGEEHVWGSAGWPRGTSHDAGVSTLA